MKPPWDGSCFTPQELNALRARARGEAARLAFSQEDRSLERAFTDLAYQLDVIQAFWARGEAVENSNTEGDTTPPSTERASEPRTGSLPEEEPPPEELPEFRVRPKAKPRICSTCGEPAWRTSAGWTCGEDHVVTDD